ncbi:MAG: hypothetical protein WCO00_02220 [Rhodospirillaceae bacterium]
MIEEPAANIDPVGGTVWNRDAGAASGPAPGQSPAVQGEIDRLTAALSAARAEAAEAAVAREDALTWVRELEAAVRERNGMITELRAALSERDRRIGQLSDRVERTQGRISEVERSLERTVELQRSLEAEFDQARRVQDQTAVVLAGARNATERSRTELAERDAQIRQLQAEVARRGPPGTPAAVGTALTDLFKAARLRRAERLALTQPWRVPPTARR